MTVGSFTRRLSAGVELFGNQAHARVWAPACRTVDVAVEPREGTDRRISPLGPEGDGYFSGAFDALAGDRYWFRLNGETLRPDPVSRYQPDGPHGPSVIVDPSRFRW